MHLTRYSKMCQTNRAVYFCLLCLMSNVTMINIDIFLKSWTSYCFTYRHLLMDHAPVWTAGTWTSRRSTWHSSPLVLVTLPGQELWGKPGRRPTSTRSGNRPPGLRSWPQVQGFVQHMLCFVFHILYISLLKYTIDTYLVLYNYCWILGATQYYQILCFMWDVEHGSSLIHIKTFYFSLWPVSER